MKRISNQSNIKEQYNFNNWKIKRKLDEGLWKATKLAFQTLSSSNPGFGNVVTKVVGSDGKIKSTKKQPFNINRRRTDIYAKMSRELLDRDYKSGEAWAQQAYRGELPGSGTQQLPGSNPKNRQFKSGKQEKDEHKARDILLRQTSDQAWNREIQNRYLESLDSGNKEGTRASIKRNLKKSFVGRLFKRMSDYAEKP